MNVRVQNPILDMVLREHAELDRQIEEFLDWCRELRELGIPHFNEMGVRTQRLRESLAEHMRHEEASPLLNKRSPAAPELEATRAQLRKEHREILQTLDKLSARLQACECDYTCWSEALDDFKEALAVLRRHEEVEVQLARALPSER
jgi:hypothetical protein